MVTPLPKQNDPLAMIRAFTQPRRNQLAGLASGLLSANDWGQGMAAGFAQAAQGRERDDAYAATQKAEAERQRQLQETIGYLRTQQNGQTWADAVEKGLVDPKDAFKGWYEESKGVADSSVRYGVNPIFGQFEDGSWGYGVQGTDGSFKQVDTGDFKPADPRTINTEKAAGTAIGKAEGANAVAAPGMAVNLERMDAQTDNVIAEIDKALGQVAWDSTGVVGQAMGALAGSKAYDLRSTATTIKANLGFAELQAMRDASPTGGALGQVAVQELEALQSTLANLDPNQSEPQLRANLEKIKVLMERQKEYRRAAAEVKYGPGATTAPPAGGGMDDVDAILRDLGI